MLTRNNSIKRKFEQKEVFSFASKNCLPKGVIPTKRYIFFLWHFFFLERLIHESKWRSWEAANIVGKAMADQWTLSNMYSIEHDGVIKKFEKLIKDFKKMES